MRIAYLTCVYPPYPGGIGMVAQGMASEMKRRGHEVQVFTPFRQSMIRDSYFMIHGLQPWFRWGNAALLPQLLWRLRDFDIIHVLYPFFGAAEFVPLLRKVMRAKPRSELRSTTGAKIVVHHLMDAAASGWRGKFFALHTAVVMPRIFKAADLVIAISEDYFKESELVRVYQEFDHAPPLEFVPNGVDTDLFRPIRPISPIGPISPIILFVGGLDRAHYFKGVHVLIEALRILQWGGIQFRCEIVGEGEMRKEYERHASEAGLCPDIKESAHRVSRVILAKGSVRFLGLVPHRDLPDYYRRASVCVVPATERIECFSIAAAEAQACGIPAIVSDFPGVRVTVEDGITGFIVRPGDPEDLARKLFDIIEHPSRAKKMGEAGRARAERMYSWEVVGDKLEKIYASLRH